MKKSRGKSRLKVSKEAKRRARAGVGMPPAARVIPEKREKPPKHKETLANLLQEE